MEYNPKHIERREIGHKHKRPQEPMTRLEIVDWLRAGMDYIKGGAQILRAPLGLTVAYWLLVPGLYLWYRPLVIPMHPLDYGDLGIQDFVLL
jgi:hypothetical protein